MAANGIPFPWWWDDGTISTNLDFIWGMSDKASRGLLKPDVQQTLREQLNMPWENKGSGGGGPWGGGGSGGGSGGGGPWGSGGGGGGGPRPPDLEEFIRRGQDRFKGFLLRTEMRCKPKVER